MILKTADLKESIKMLEEPDYKTLLLNIVKALYEDDGHSDYSAIQEPLEKALTAADTAYTLYLFTEVEKKALDD